MSLTMLKIVAPDYSKHRSQLYDLIAKAFSRRGYYTVREACEKRYFDKSHYDWETSRVGLIGQTIASHLGIWDFQMRVGSARLRVAGVGAVATHNDYRGMGLMSKMMDATSDAVTDAGYDVSLLFGIDNMYHKYGYVRAWPEVHYSLELADMPKPPEKPQGPLRRMQLKARRDITRMYNRMYKDITGTVVRPTYNHWARFWPQEGFRWADKRGKTVGYVFVAKSDETLQCTEAGGDPDQVLRALGVLMRRLGCNQVRFDFLPPEGAIARRLRQSNCTQTTQYRRSGGAMIRILNLRSTLEKISDELTDRLQNSGMNDWQGVLNISSGNDRVSLQITLGNVTVMDMYEESRHNLRGGDHIAQFIVGTESPDEVMDAGNMRLTGDARDLVRALFPAQRPQMLAWDRF